jgi:hypothetical protein
MQIIPVTARDHVPEYVVRRVKEMLNDNLEHEVYTEMLIVHMKSLFDARLYLRVHPIGKHESFWIAKRGERMSNSEIYREKYRAHSSSRASFMLY